MSKLTRRQALEHARRSVHETTAATQAIHALAKALAARADGTDQQLRTLRQAMIRLALELGHHRDVDTERNRSLWSRLRYLLTGRPTLPVELGSETEEPAPAADPPGPYAGRVSEKLAAVVDTATEESRVTDPDAPGQV